MADERDEKLEEVIRSFLLGIFYLLKGIRVSLVYLLFGAGLWFFEKETFIIPFFVLSVIFAVASLRVSALRPFAFILGDVQRWIYAFNRYRAKKRAMKLLHQMGINDEEAEVFLYENEESATLKVEKPVIGISPERFISHATDFKNLFDAVSVSVRDEGQGKLSIRFIKIDPLDEPVILSEPAKFNPETMSVSCAKDADGSEIEVSFKEIAGVLVSGMPGSGKTAGVSSFLTPLALSEEVDLSVIDCKGGTDWTSYEKQSSRFLSVGSAEDFTAVRDVLTDLEHEMVSRLQTQKEILGVSNYWNAKDRKNLAFKLVVIDECQELFVKQTDKELAAVAAEINRLVTTLVKRGRSAGVCVLLITQKPTSDSIPTSIRDNSGLRICFRVDTADAEKAALGGLPDDLSVPRAMSIPSSRKGGAVLVDDRGSRKNVRFYYLPEETLEEVLNV